MTDPIHAKDAFSLLNHLLDRERHALINGDLAAMTTLVEEKEALLTRLGSMDHIEQEALASLQGKALRNQELLDSTLRGIRAVAGRFATLRKIRKSLETYDEFGQKTTLSAPRNPHMEKRA